jgi:signal transduction histidine kinase
MMSRLVLMVSRFMRDPRGLQAAFVVLMCVFVAALAWLGFRLVIQDRELERQRAAEQRDTIAALAVATLEQRLAAWRQKLADDHLEPPADGVIVRFDHTRIQAVPPGQLVYNASLSESPEPDLAATALLERGATLVAQKQIGPALDAYRELENHGAATAAGMPAALVARLGRLSAYEHAGNAPAAAKEAQLLMADLDRGRWPVSYATYKHLASEARNQLPASERRPSIGESTADTVTWLWDEWSSARLPEDRAWASRRTAFGPTLIIWSTTRDRGVSLVAGSSFIEREFGSPLPAGTNPEGVTVSLESQDDGKPVIGSAAPATDPAAIRLASDERLPWTIRVSTARREGRVSSSRQTLLMGGLIGLIAFAGMGTWFVGGAVRRELEVARLKSDFVSAVSHEFRTPLTTVVQLSELLKNGRVATEADRDAYYALLYSEGTRLRRLVERLLNFGQIESGRTQFRMAVLELTAFARTAVREFCAAHAQDGSRIEVEADDTATFTVAADAEALATVLWNLLENAVKYSPDRGPIVVRIGRDGDAACLQVSDQGIGIPESEQQAIFEPFVRGVDARARQIRGTGVGLALAQAIVCGHGGDITLESTPGRGSTFVVSLPLVPEGAQS